MKSINVNSDPNFYFAGKFLKLMHQLLKAEKERAGEYLILNEKQIRNLLKAVNPMKNPNKSKLQKGKIIPT